MVGRSAFGVGDSSQVHPFNRKMQTQAIQMLGASGDLNAAATLIVIAEQHGKDSELVRTAIETATDILLTINDPAAISDAIGGITGLEGNLDIIASAVGKLAEHGTMMNALNAELASAGAENAEQALLKQVLGNHGICLASKYNSQPPISESREVLKRAIRLLGNAGGAETSRQLLRIYNDYVYQAPESFTSTLGKLYSRGIGGKETIAAILQVAYFNGMSMETAFHDLMKSCETNEGLQARLWKDIGALKSGKDGWLTHPFSPQSVACMRYARELEAAIGMIPSAHPAKKFTLVVIPHGNDAATAKTAGLAGKTGISN